MITITMTTGEKVMCNGIEEINDTTWMVFDFGMIANNNRVVVASRIAKIEKTRKEV